MAVPLAFPSSPRSRMPQDPEKTSPEDADSSLVENSMLYKEFLAERDEILKHKWLESEKVGRDIGFERALLDWIVRYRAAWRQNRMRKYLFTKGDTTAEAPLPASPEASVESKPAQSQRSKS